MFSIVEIQLIFEIWAVFRSLNKTVGATLIARNSFAVAPIRGHQIVKVGHSKLGYNLVNVNPEIIILRPKEFRA